MPLAQGSQPRPDDLNQRLHEWNPVCHRWLSRPRSATAASAGRAARDKSGEQPIENASAAMTSGSGMPPVWSSTAELESREKENVSLSAAAWAAPVAGHAWA